jgi:hypothetical protein
MPMAEDWNFYFCNVNNVLASVFLDLGLREVVPIKDKPNLLWVWIYLSGRAKTDYQILQNSIH